MEEFDMEKTETIRDDMVGIVGSLVDNTLSAEYIGLPQYEQTLRRLAEMGKKAEKILGEYRAWIAGKPAEEPEEEPPRVMETKTSPGAILEELAPLFPYGGIGAKLIVDQNNMTEHVYSADVRCVLEIRWRETNTIEQAQNVYQTLSKTRGISRFDWEYNQH